MTALVRLSWVTQNRGYTITDPMPVADAQVVARDLHRKFPLVHETLTIHQCEAAPDHRSAPVTRICEEGDMP